MDDDVNQQILTEIKKLRRGNQAAALFCIFLLIAVIVYSVLRPQFNSYPRQSQHTVDDSWTAVDIAIQHVDFDGASAMAQRLVARYPDDYYGYIYLGNIALRTGHIKEAEGYYARGHELFPTEQHEKYLDAIQTRLESENARQTKGH